MHKLFYFADYVSKLKELLFSMSFIDEPVEEPAPSLTSYQEFPDREDLMIARISRYQPD